LSSALNDLGSASKLTACLCRYLTARLVGDLLGIHQAMDGIANLLVERMNRHARLLHGLRVIGAIAHVLEHHSQRIVGTSGGIGDGRTHGLVVGQVVGHALGCASLFGGRERRIGHRLSQSRRLVAVRCGRDRLEVLKQQALSVVQETLYGN